MFWNFILFSSGVYFSREFPNEANKINQSIDNLINNLNFNDNINNNNIFKLFFKK
jgi:hypothetical protein